MKPQLNIAVRSLVEFVLRTGDIHPVFTGPARLQDAIRAHQRLQKSRPDYYSAEIPISHSIETERLILKIGGRIDGVFRYPDNRVVVEEIKTTTRDDLISTEHPRFENPLHWGQVKVYAYLYALQNSLSEIEVQLTYYHLRTEKITEYQKHFTIEELRLFFKELVDNYIEWAEILCNWAEVRNNSIGSLAFPYSNYRVGQRAMAVEVYRTIRDKEQLIAQAATGIGKTMAVIFPTIKHIGEGSISRAFYLTPRTTGQMAAEKALDELRDKGLKLKSLTLTAKEKICFSPGQVCSPDECSFARGHFDRIKDAIRNTFTKDRLNREIIEAIADRHHVCPFELSLELTPVSDFIICDYNYVFDPKVYLRQLFEEEKGKCVFLTDEAHNLVDRSREMFSAEIQKQAFLDFKSFAGEDLKPLRQLIEKIIHIMDSLKPEFQVSELPVTISSPPEKLYPLLRKFMTLSEKWLMGSTVAKQALRSQLMTIYFEVGFFLRIWEQFDAAYSVFLKTEAKNFQIKLFCIDPAQQLRKILERADAAILFSATVTPTDYFKAVLGCNEKAKKLTIPSPFPVDNLKIFLADGISTCYKDREATIDGVCRAVLDFVSLKVGNYLLFFPSYQYMDLAYNHLRNLEDFKTKHHQIRLLIQTQGMKEKERKAYLDCFNRDNTETLIGLAVMGGIFGEGIDLVGERLCGVVIVGVGLPGITPERELIRSYFMKMNGSGFEFAYLYPGINRVLQAVGRVIRSETDRGVVLLIDRRFSTVQYRSLLPNTWRIIRLKDRQNFDSELSCFWNDRILQN